MWVNRRQPRQAATAVISVISILAMALMAVAVIQARNGNADAYQTAPVPPPPVATVSLTAPRPTSTENSPSAPDPHPPAGGKAPDGNVPGGAKLASRGLLAPKGAPPLPSGLQAHAWVLVDLSQDTVLAAKDPHGRYQPASLVKLLTAVTLAPQLPGGKKILASAQAANTEGSHVGVYAGAEYTADELFTGMMLVSGNDAAQALAEANGGVVKTVQQMNDQAAALGAYDTYVQTPSGLDGWQQLTSAYDMSLVLKAYAANPRLVAYDKPASGNFPARQSSTGPVPQVTFANQNVNYLTTVPGAVFAKSGFTDAAQNTYACVAERNGRKLGVVFLRSNRYPADQFQQAATLLNWGYALPAATKPVGTLDGPVRVMPSATATYGTKATPNAIGVAPAASRRAANPIAWGWGSIIGAAAILLVATAITLPRQWRRRNNRGYS